MVPIGIPGGIQDPMEQPWGIFGAVMGSLGGSCGALWGADHVGAQVDAEDGDGAEGQRDVGHDEEQEGGDLGDVARQSVRDGLLQVVEDQPTCGAAP